MTRNEILAGRRIKNIFVTALQDTFDYNISFPPGSDNIIVIAPNGFGKTALLSLLKSCLELDLRKVEGHRFRSFVIDFDDDSRWKFEKRDVTGGRISNRTQPEAKKTGWFRRTKSSPLVNVHFYDQNGEEISAQEPNLDKIDPIVLIRAAELYIPSKALVTRIVDYIAAGDISTAINDITAFHPNFFENQNVNLFLRRHQPEPPDSKTKKINCVFIETQRLMNSIRSAIPDNAEIGIQEEVLRQAHHLSSLLQSTYSNYASISQSLDRSFPNRLIARAKISSDNDALKLRQDLNEIEKKRELLTKAGILVEQSEQLVPPTDEYLPRVSDALQIYVDDSRAKLATFDNIYSKVSVFRDLLSKKLKPKELIINREKGVEIYRGNKKVALEGLSSGEKHEFIMLFKLIFETPSQSIVLIDEPEISLHVLWQLEFMPDLIKIQQANSFQSIVATHSPQIFQSYNHLIVDLADQVTL